MTLMDRKNNLRAFERGVRAMLGQGIRVKVDLIVGLPGDTVESVRRGLHYLHDNGFNDVQVFNLAVLPGTAFRQEAAQLGLKYQPRPPYYVLSTPTLGREDLYGLMQEAQDLFEIEFDAQPRPVLDFAEGRRGGRVWRVDLDAPERPPRRRRRRAPRRLRSGCGRLTSTATAARSAAPDPPAARGQPVHHAASGAGTGRSGGRRGRAAPVPAAAAGSADRRLPGRRRPISTSSTPCSPAA